MENTQGSPPKGEASMLLGQHEGKVGSKGRIAFPKKFRGILGDSLIVTLGYENSLIIVSSQSWQALLEGTEGRPFTDAATRETQRFILGGASAIRLDSKGRFIIPSYLRDYAKIATEVIFLGMMRYCEMWDKNHWEAYRKNLEKNIGTIAERLSEEKKEE